jgi:hypothetical protein
MGILAVRRSSVSPHAAVKDQMVGADLTTEFPALYKALIVVGSLLVAAGTIMLWPTATSEIRRRRKG